MHAAQLFHKQSEEQGEVHRSWCLTNHSLQVAIHGFFPREVSMSFQVLLANEAATVLANCVEGLLKLLDLGLVKHWEDIGHSPLRSLFWWPWP